MNQSPHGAGPGRRLNDLMDERLVAWARASVARRRGGDRPFLPPLWLFTDANRLPDPRPAVARLPKGLAGVVLRHDGAPDRAALGRDLARLCRARRLTLVVAGDVRLAASLRAGVHLRAGRWPSAIRPSARAGDQLRAWWRGAGQRPPRWRRAGVPLTGLFDREPPERRHTRTAALGKACARRRHRRGSAWRDRRPVNSALAEPAVRGGRGDHRVK